MTATVLAAKERYRVALAARLSTSFVHARTPEVMKAAGVPVR